MMDQSEPDSYFVPSGLFTVDEPSQKAIHEYEILDPARVGWVSVNLRQDTKDYTNTALIELMIDRLFSQKVYPRLGGLGRQGSQSNLFSDLVFEPEKGGEAAVNYALHNARKLLNKVRASKLFIEPAS
ncbi:uncharacterized protein N7529_002402 [Penicillium soppii]|uniref:uncharacterized protein n=1 Tax=Penicillium soppii TaxID=69789 RepID=UPI002549759D|nr:uncharacterized protein N7529_002402 [Penicillium soppii]KAJ5873972.1 hypothetical protein N7529_002402 [Penicillium soppii]